MKIPVQRLAIPALAAVCVLAAAVLIPAVHLPRDNAPLRAGSRAVSAPALDSLAKLPSSMNEVVSKHLFIIQREATGLNSYPDLVVKGVFLGTERSALFSLKSRPQANLRVWEGQTESALSQMIDPRDPRQPIAQFLREWDIVEIVFDGVKVKHFITDETEMYTVNYTPARKVKDDAARGYGQGIIPQGEGGAVTASTGAQRTPSAMPAVPPPASATAAMADRVSVMLRQMPAAQRQQFMQRLNRETQSSSRSNDPRFGGQSQQSSQQRNGTQQQNHPNNQRNSQQQQRGNTDQQRRR
ncbi:MAG: hypothetical protein WC959_08485 [Kiritimatiellales bacterium]